MNNNIWVSKDFLQYCYRPEITQCIEPEKCKQQYNIYQHAENSLLKNSNEEDLACAIFQLNRAIDFRNKILKENYNFEKIPFFKGKKLHDIMEELGIIKQLLKTKL